MPLFVDRQTKIILSERLSFWKVIEYYAKEHDAFVPVKIFKHGIQSLYSKTKGGVDGSAQARVIMRSSTSSLK